MWFLTAVHCYVTLPWDPSGLSWTVSILSFLSWNCLWGPQQGSAVLILKSMKKKLLTLNSLVPCCSWESDCFLSISNSPSTLLGRAVPSSWSTCPCTFLNHVSKLPSLSLNFPPGHLLNSPHPTPSLSGWPCLYFPEKSEAINCKTLIQYGPTGTIWHSYFLLFDTLSSLGFQDVSISLYPFSISGCCSQLSLLAPHQQLNFFYFW